MGMSLLQSKPRLGWAGDRARRIPSRPRWPSPTRAGSTPRARTTGPILAAHGQALDAGEDGYLDPSTGWWCFTAAYLWSRGACCDSGCRHCPYVHQAERLAGGAEQR